MDAIIPGAQVHVIDTIGDLVRENNSLKIKVALLTQDNEKLSAENANLVALGDFNRTIVERVAVVFNAACLLDDDTIKRSVLGDALEGDVRPIDGRKR